MGCGASKTDIRRKHEAKAKLKKPNLTTTNDKNNNVDENQLKIGSRVHVRGYVGTVKFLGSTKLGDGEWVGVELDQVHQQGNDGFFDETKYFDCKPKHGFFVRPEVAHLHKNELDVVDVSKLSLETIVKMQNRMKQVLAKIRLRNLIKQSGNEKRIDKHVMDTPLEAEKSINQLSEYLTKPFENQRDKAYAIFRWLSFNISYDVDGFFGRSKKTSCAAEDVLINKSCVCEGYSKLYEALGKAAGLEIHVISGYAKGYGYKAGQRVEGVNHAWNALHIENQWYLSDATWGAGVLGGDLIFQRIPNTYRFLMHPEYAIFDHFPEDEKWQFLDEPVNREAFEKAVVISGPLYEMGVELLTHKDSHYDGDSIQMDFYCPGRKMKLMAKVKDRSGKDLPGRERAMLRRCGVNQVRLHAQFPLKGNYNIGIFVNVEGTWTFGLTYHITATKGCGVDRGGFPRLSSSFYDNDFELISPLENIETNNGPAEIKLQYFGCRFRSIVGHISGVNGSEKHIVKNQALTFSEKTTDGFVLRVDTPTTGTYLLKIFARKEEEGGDNQFLCEYYVTSTENHKRLVAGFPRISDHFHSWGMELVDPKENIISSDGKTEIKIKAKELGGLDISTIRLNGNVRPQNGANMNLLPNQSLCFTETIEDKLVMKVDTYCAGIYQLNIFGTDMRGNKGVWLCSYLINNIEKDKRKIVGFPALSELFHTLGMKLIRPKENIHSRDGKAVISINCPENVDEIKGFIQKGQETIHGCCKTTTDENKTVTNISIELPSQGLYKLNVFGKNDGENTNNFLFSYYINAEKGAGK